MALPPPTHGNVEYRKPEEDDMTGNVVCPLDVVNVNVSITPAAVGALPVVNSI